MHMMKRMVMAFTLAGGLILGTVEQTSPKTAAAAAQQSSSRSVRLPNADIYALNSQNVIFVMRPGMRSFQPLLQVRNVDGNLIGLDFRPADGNANAVYGLTDAGSVYQISLVRPLGATTLVSRVTPRFGGGFQSLMDFNPVVNALRLIGSSDENYALVNSGGNLNVTAVQTPMAYDPADINQAVNPNLSGGAYTNNVAGAASTLFYAFDYNLDTFVTISSVNAGGSSNTGGGLLQTIGPVVDQNNNPINLSPTADMDIFTDRNGVNTLVAISGQRLFTIDLNQLTPNLPLGQVRNVVAQGITMSDFGGGFIDIAISPFGTMRLRSGIIPLP
ncbi:MAG: DUF4394 domain-containing protein [Blastocatellia bacterium]|nr:DUF4394 domain-containing protein [Blastocatellia bacterium]